MGQFKPMVKMETTEPSVVLKLKKGGHVAMKSKGEDGYKPMKKMDGGAMSMLAGTPALVGRPAMNAPVRAPGKPSMAARRAAMMARPAPRPAMMAKPEMMARAAMNTPVMKNGGKAGKDDMAQDKAMVKKAFKQHDMQEHKGGKGTKLSLKKGGKMATGGVVLGNAGGYKTGGVVMGAGGFKKGGAAKKLADGGGLMGVLGQPNALTPRQGSQGGGGGDAQAGLGQVNQGAGTIGSALGKAAEAIGGGGGGGFGPGAPGGPVFGGGQGAFMKKGGSAKKFADGGRIDSGRPVKMPEGKKKPTPPVATNQLSGTFKKGGSVKRLQGGGDAQSDRETRGYNASYASQKAEALADREAVNPMTYIRPLVEKVKGMFASTPAPGAVTKTKESTTVVPAKKRSGGKVDC